MVLAERRKESWFARSKNKRWTDALGLLGLVFAGCCQSYFCFQGCCSCCCDTRLHPCLLQCSVSPASKGGKEGRESWGRPRLSLAFLRVVTFSSRCIHHHLTVKAAWCHRRRRPFLLFPPSSENETKERTAAGERPSRSKLGCSSLPLSSASRLSSLLQRLPGCREKGQAKSCARCCCGLQSQAVKAKAQGSSSNSGSRVKSSSLSSSSSSSAFEV